MKSPKGKAMIRRGELKRKYGLSEENFDRMVREQGGRCALCNEPEKLCVDHDHETGQVRALLCRPCNIALGALRDNSALMRKAADYVEVWSS